MKFSSNNEYIYLAFNLLRLTADLKLYKDRNKKIGFFLKPFDYKVMTIFTTHHCCFTTFRRLLVAKEYVEAQLILFEGYCCCKIIA